MVPALFYARVIQTNRRAGRKSNRYDRSWNDPGNESLTERRKMEVNENRGRLCRKKLQGKIRKKKNHQKEKDITGSVKRANHNKGSMIVSDPTELVQPGGNNHSSRFVRLCVGACFIHGAGWHTLHSLSASGKRDSEKRKIIWKPVKAPLGIGAKERGIASSV